MRERVAVIGAGVSGLTAAYLLQRRYDVTLFEAEGRLGGHAHTHELDTVAVDSGFIVHNDVTYPNLLRLFAELGVATQDSEMSMSVRDEATGLEYAGARGVRGPVRPAAQPREPALPADARRGPALPPPGPRGGGRDVAARRGRHLRRVPRRRRLLAVLRRDLRGARGVRGLVVGAGALAAVPGALPVHVPREPRDALDRRLAPLAHRRRRLAHLRRARREGPVGGGGVDARARRGPLRRRGACPRRRRRRAPLRPRRRRHPRPGRAAPALRADRRAGVGARVLPLLAQRDRAAHRHLGAPARRGGPGVVEPAARAGGVEGAGQLRHDAADAVAPGLHSPRPTSSPSTRPTGSTRPRSSRAWTTSTPPTPRSRSRPSTGCRG